MRNRKIVNAKKRKRNDDNSHLRNEPPCLEAKESEFYKSKDCISFRILKPSKEDITYKHTKSIRIMKKYTHFTLSHDFPPMSKKLKRSVLRTAFGPHWFW